MRISVTLALFVLSVVLVAPSALLAKDRDWETGKLADSKTVETGVQSKQLAPPVPGAPSLPTDARITVTAELLIVGTTYTYTARSTGTNSILARSCRYIVGDPIKYVQEKSTLYLLDADGKECRATVVRQERTAPAHNP